MKKEIFLGMLVVGLMFIAACGSSSSTTPAASSSSTGTLSMTLTSNSGSYLKDISESIDGESKAFDSTSYPTVKCKDGAGNSYSGTIGSDGSVSIASIPTGTPLVCYVLDSTGVPVTQVTFTSSGVIGGQFDAPKISGNATASVTLNSNAQVATSNADTATNLASSMTGSAKDVTGSYSMTCNKTVGLLSDSTLDDSNSHCTTFAAHNSHIYLHQISGTISGATIYAAAPWISKTAYTGCGSTEGLGTLPSGLTLTDSTQSGAFQWNSNFTGISKTSTSLEIAAMIKNFGNTVNGLSQTYDNFRTTNSTCTGMDQVSNFTSDQKTQSCAILYYWNVLHDFIFSNPNYCVPQLDATWSNGIPTITPKSALASSVTPITRFQFMSLQFTTNSTGNTFGRLSGKGSWAFTVYNSSEHKDYQCFETDKILVEWTMPQSDPVIGTQIPIKMINNSTVAAVDGTAASTTICKSIKQGSDMAPNGYYFDITLTKETDR